MNNVPGKIKIDRWDLPRGVAVGLLVFNCFSAHANECQTAWDNAEYSSEFCDQERGKIYRCKTEKGVEYSDKSCENAMRKEGNEWVNVQDEDRKAAEDAMRKIEEDSKKRKQELERQRIESETEKILAAAAEEERRLCESHRTERQLRIEKVFSPWDGSHKELEGMIKNKMMNPSSYEHVQTEYVDKCDHVIVYTKFRGTNAFGAVVTQKAQAGMTVDGVITSLFIE